MGWDVQGLSGQWREAWFDRSIRRGCRGDSDERRGPLLSFWGSLNGRGAALSFGEGSELMFPVEAGVREGGGRVAVLQGLVCAPGLVWTRSSSALAPGVGALPLLAVFHQLPQQSLPLGKQSRVSRIPHGLQGVQIGLLPSRREAVCECGAPLGQADWPRMLSARAWGPLSW